MLKTHAGGRHTNSTQLKKLKFRRSQKPIPSTSDTLLQPKRHEKNGGNFQLFKISNNNCFKKAIITNLSCQKFFIKLLSAVKLQSIIPTQKHKLSLNFVQSKFCISQLL